MPTGFLAACLAAGCLMAFGLFGWNPDPALIGYYIASIAIMTSQAGAVAAAPAFIIIVLAEAFAWRSLIFHLLAGGGIGLLGEQIAIRNGFLEFADQRLALILAAGFAGGFVYWLIAGRLAGNGLRGNRRTSE